MSVVYLHVGVSKELKTVALRFQNETVIICFTKKTVALNCSSEVFQKGAFEAGTWKECVGRIPKQR